MCLPSKVHFDRRQETHLDVWVDGESKAPRRIRISVFDQYDSLWSLCISCPLPRSLVQILKLGQYVRFVGQRIQIAKQQDLQTEVREPNQRMVTMN